MKIKREILVVFLAVLFIPLTCAGGFAEMDVGGDYALGGYIAVGGGFRPDTPRGMNRGYLKQYVPFPEGFLADTDLELKSKDGLEYYRFRMSDPGLRDQDYLLQLGKLGLYHAEVEYDQLQHLYCTVNPNFNNIGIVLQRLRFSGYYTPTPEFALFAENTFLRRTGWQAGSYYSSPSNPYNFTTGYLRPINYKQNDMKVGVEYDQPTDQKSIFQGRVSYHLSTFDNGQGDVLGRQQPIGTVAYVSLPPSNMANYVTGEGALNLKSYMTRITGAMSYGWLSQNDYVFDSTTGAGPPATVAGRSEGLAGLTASTFTADIAGLTRPIAPLALKYSYSAYNYSNDNTANQIIRTAFGTNQPLLNAEQYSYFRQAVNLGADYRMNNMVAFTLGYSWKGVSRTDGQGNTSSNSPQVGIKLSPTNWLSLMGNYSFTSRTGSNYMWAQTMTSPTTYLTYKYYSGNLNRNSANVIAEVYPANAVTCSVNFSVYDDSYTDSGFGLKNDQGWSGGADVSWRPHDRVALSLGYDHQQLQTKAVSVTGPYFLSGSNATITGDAGPTLVTSDSYDTFFASADFKIIPNKLKLTARGSYSFSNSNYHNQVMPNLNEYFADIRTFLTYQFNEHWACRAGYIFEIFGMSKAYQTLYTQGINANGTAGSAQPYNTLDGYFRNGTANLFQAFVQYKF